MAKEQSAPRRAVDPLHRLLAEVLRLQRWAGGDSISAARIYGLMHGFESVIDEESESRGISRDLQDKVEDILEAIEGGTQSADGMSFKNRLRQDGIDETDADRVIALCQLQSRFLEAIEKLGHEYHPERAPTHDWFGALHYVELHDSTEGVHRKLHAVLSPTVPRIGEVVTPEGGSRMRVVDVEYVIADQGNDESAREFILIPYVVLEAEDDGDTD